MWVGCLQQRGGGPTLPPGSLQDVAGEVRGGGKGGEGHMSKRTGRASVVWWKVTAMCWTVLLGGRFCARVSSGVCMHQRD